MDTKHLARHNVLIAVRLKSDNVIMVRKAFGFLLVLWFAALTACPPVTMTHTHAEGDSHHEHAAHGHGHHHDHHASKSPSRQATAFQAGMHRHIHIWFLGAEAHLKLEEHPTDSSETLCIGEVLLLDDCVSSGPAGSEVEVGKRPEPNLCGLVRLEDGDRAAAL